jgi:hypothetical protein
MRYIELLFIIVISLTAGYIGGHYHPDDYFGGVRGGARTGFYLIDGESIAISSSSPMVDFVIAQDNATSTIMITSDHASSSACIVFEDTDSAGFSYCAYLNGVQTCSSTNICH